MICSSMMKYFSKVTFFATEMGTFSVDLHETNLDNDNINSYEDDPEILFMSVILFILAWRNKFEKHKAFKKDISK